MIPQFLQQQEHDPYGSGSQLRRLIYGSIIIICMSWLGEVLDLFRSAVNRQCGSYLGSMQNLFCGMGIQLSRFSEGRKRPSTIYVSASKEGVVHNRSFFVILTTDSFEALFISYFKPAGIW